MFNNSKLLLMGSVSILSFATAPALAQVAAEETVSESSSNEIVVTGSRIARRDFEAASPIVTLGSEAIAATGAVTLESALNQLPQFSAGSTAFSNDLNATGQATLNLRGLGAQRNLVLLDGRRLQPSNSSQVIDINTIPTILVGGTEIISGGASAIYGSDAISGVVNFKLRELNGLEISGQNTLTERGDGGIREVSIGAGTGFADGRGRIIIGASYTDRDAVHINNRAFFRQSRGVSGTIPFGMLTPGANPASQAALDAAFAAYGVAPGSVTGNSQIGINADGTLFSNGSGVFNYRDNVPHLFNIGSALLQTPQSTYTQIPLERVSTFGRASIEATDNIKLFVQGLYTDYTSVTIQDAAPNAGIWPLRVPITNPFIPDALVPVIQSRANPTAPVVVTKRYSEAGPRRTVHESATWQVLGGASGSFGQSGVTWELYGSTGKSVLDDITHGSVFTDKVQQLVSAPDGGASLCTGGWPVIAWAHGTVGIGDSCAPSRNPRSERDRTYLGHWLNEGYAVVATDYQGLGSPGPHPYMNSRMAAYSTLDSVRAVLKGDFGLANKVLLVGQSQGGGAAFATAGYAADYAPDVNVRGTIATGLPNLAAAAAVSGDDGDKVDRLIGYLLYIASVAHQLDPKSNPGDILTERAMAVFDQAEQLCVMDMFTKTVEAGLTRDNSFKGDFWQHYASMTAYAGYPTLKITTPVFVGTGADDADTPYVMQKSVVDGACAAGSTIEWRVYPKQDHSGAVNRSFLDSRVFAQRVMAGEVIAGSCPILR